MFEFLNIPFDYAFGPLLALPTIWAVIILSILISLITTLIYKWTTNQQLMKDLKDEIKRLQSEAKTLKDQPQKAMEVQKQAMETNMKYMSHSMRPTIITFIPIILIFGWMTANFAYEQIMPEQEFSISIAFQDGIKGNITIQTPKEISLTGEMSREITNGESIFTMKGTTGKDKIIKTITTSNKEKIVLNLFGWKLGWLGTYILTSIISSIALRKWMKI